MRFFYLFVGLLGILSTAKASPYLSRQWTRSTLDSPYYGFRNQNGMAPLLTKDLVIQGNAIDGIKAFHRKTGNEVWSRQLFNGVEGGAAIDDEVLYFGSNNGQFYAVDVNSGKTLWKFMLNSESLTHPLVAGEAVYHVTGNNTLYAFNKKSGETLWVKTNAAKSNMTVRGQTAPVLENGILYLGFSDGSFSAINAINGRELWSKRIGDDKKFNDVDARAVLTKSCILVASYANSLYCLNKSSGQIQWRHDVGGYHAVLVDAQKIYYPTTLGEIHVLDEGSGKLLKKVINLKGLSSEIVSLGPYLIYGETQGALVVRNKSDLQKVVSFSPGEGIFARPTIDQEGRQIYLMSNQANLYRLDMKDQPDNAFQWSHAQ